MKLASFDIFDTTLLRRCGLPENVFEILACKLFPDDPGKREAFVHWRSFQAYGHTLDEIYSSVSETDFPPYSPAQLAGAEMETESLMLRANPAVKKLIERKRAEGYTILFLSDMYLPSRFLESVLRREGCLQGDEQVVVSCEHGATKARGSLYDKVRQLLSPDTWEHYGDHRHSDYRMARRHGVKAHCLSFPYTDFEKRLNSMRKTYLGWQLSILAGESRYVRLCHGDTPHARIAADYVAALYIPFVKFVVADAVRRGLSALHFLSRDGYIMRRIAMQLPPAGIDMRYLFVSRKALKTGSALIPKLLEQECLTRGNCAMVDVGWLGTSRKMINGILRNGGCPDCPTYYLGIRGDVFPPSDGLFIPYYRATGLTANTAIIESYYSASPYPSTAGYTTDSGGKVVPVFVDGAAFEMGEPAATNCEVAEQLAAELNDYPFIDPHMLRRWADLSLESISRLRDEVPLRPFLGMSGPGKERLVRRLGPVDVIHMTLLGKKHWGMFERGSYQITFGRRLGNMLCDIHDFTVRVNFLLSPRLYRFFPWLSRKK